MSNQEQQGSLSEKFQGFGAAPSDDLWDSIAAAVDEKKRRKGLYWWWLGSGLAASFVLVYLSINFFAADENLTETHSKLSQPSLFRTKSESTSITGHKPYQISDDVVISVDLQKSVENVQAIHNSVDHKQSLILPVPVNNEIQSIEKLENQIATDESHNQYNNLDKEDKKLAQEDEVKMDIEKLSNPDIDLLSMDVDHPQMLNVDLSKKMRYNPWEIGFNLAYYTDLNISFLSKKQEVYPTTSADFSENAFISGSQPESINITPGLFPPSSAVIPSTQSGVSRNVNIDFYAAKYLSKRWMFTSGLGFTRSTYKTIYNNGFLMTQLTHINSVIVPIGISFDAVKLPKFKLRTALTFNNEFAFYEKLETEALSPYYGPKGFIKGYSASLQFSLGHVFQIRPRMALNVAPSFRYYLSQNIQSQNYLIKRNQWIGGKIGMIWTL